MKLCILLPCSPRRADRSFMTKLLIVDDEPLVQIGIKSMLNWAEYGIEVCGTSMNGTHALGMIDQYSPEIVITDIRMPIMNGLELAGLCRKKYGSLPLFIFLTSYEEFQLIKEAMSYEAVDYLIKLELDAHSLAAVIKKALTRLETLLGTKQDRSGSRPLLQSYFDKFFMRLLYNLFDSEEQFSLQARDLKLDFTEGCYCAAQCEIKEEHPAAMEPGKLMNLYSSSLQMSQDIIRKHIPSYVISLDTRHFAIVFHQKEMALFHQSTAEEALRSVREMVHNYFNVSITAGIGSAVEIPQKINESYQEARRAFQHTDNEHPIAAFSQENPESIKNSFNISIFKNDITKAFEEFDTDVLNKTLTEIIDLFQSHPMHFLQAADGACNILYLSLSLLPDGEDTMAFIFHNYNDGYRSIYRFTNVAQIVEWMFLLRDGLCDILKSKRKTYKDHVIANVQKYIGSHVTERLSLNEVAGVFGLSPNYLSILFKKNCRIGFSEYITQSKISRAKAMVLEQEMKIYEIAEYLGFESAFYFSKVFKKVEGISPRDFLHQNISHSKESFSEDGTSENN